MECLILEALIEMHECETARWVQDVWRKSVITRERPMGFLWKSPQVTGFIKIANFKLEKINNSKLVIAA